MPLARPAAGATLVALAVLVLAPDPRAILSDASARRPGVWLDPALRVPFASVLLRAAAPSLTPGDRVLGVRLAGDPGLRVPHDRAALLRLLEEAPAGGTVVLELRRADGATRLAVPIVAERARLALAAQWPVIASGVVFLSFALACIVGGRHPIATPLFAVSACAGVGLLSALDLALPGDGGIAGLGRARARLGVLAWSLLPGALLHLAARFPIVVPRFRRPALAAVPHALWALPAALAQLRFGEAAVVHAVERVALAASLLAGATLVAACLVPDRRRTPIERVRARAAAFGLAGAGAGPVAVAASGATPTPALSAALALGALALPLALGWAVARYRLLDPPPWLRRLLLLGSAALASLAAAAAALPALEAALGDTTQGRGLSLALVSAALLPGARRGLERLARRGAAHPVAPESLLARAGRELAGAAHPDSVRRRLAELLREGLGAADVEVVADGATARSPLGRRGAALWWADARDARGPILRPARAEDPDAISPDLVLRIEPRLGAAAVAVVAPRPDGLPYAPEELRALADVGRLAALALGHASSAAALEERVAARTEALARALADRTALLAAAERIQAAHGGEEVRAAVRAFLADRAGRPVRPAERAERAAGRVDAVLCRPPVGRDWLAVEGLSAERAADLQPQADTVCALADLALERIHLLDGLKLEVARQARELARAASGRQHAEFVRRVAHELRKPNDEIRHLVRAILPTADAATREPLERIAQVSHELARRLDCLLSRQGRSDVRRVDLVRLVDEAVRRVSLLRAERRFEVSHGLARLPLLGDPVRLVSVIENLLDNAVRATGPGGRVRVRSAWLPPAAAGPAPRVALEVEDDGAGVAPELGARIFEPGVAGFRGGFGLGLALCRDVVAAHGGSIEAESQPGRTLFRVVLPQLGPQREDAP